MDEPESPNKTLPIYFWPAFAAFVVFFFAAWMYLLAVVGHLITGEGLQLIPMASDWAFWRSLGALTLFGSLAIAAFWGIVALHQLSKVGRRLVHGTFACAYGYLSWRFWRSFAISDPEGAAGIMTFVGLFFLPLLLSMLDGVISGVADYKRKENRSTSYASGPPRSPSANEIDHR